MRAILAITAMALLLGACGNNTAGREVEQGEYSPGLNSYFQDPRTKVCFAVYAYSRMDGAGREAGGITQAAVPCTAEVMAYITPVVPPSK